MYQTLISPMYWGVISLIFLVMVFLDVRKGFHIKLCMGLYIKLCMGLHIKLCMCFVIMIKNLSKCSIGLNKQYRSCGSWSRSWKSLVRLRLFMFRQDGQLDDTNEGYFFLVNRRDVIDVLIKRDRSLDMSPLQLLIPTFDTFLGNVRSPE